MIAGKLIHPDILAALAASGHKGKVLIADANMSVSTLAGPNAAVVRLGLEPGWPTIPRVVELIATKVAIEARTTMAAPPDVDMTVQQEVTAVLPDTPWEQLDRAAFYAQARSEDVALVVVTGDNRRFGNVMLTLGVVPPAD